jgi:hypothetical protein
VVLVTISERHINGWPSEGLIIRLLIRLAVNKHIEMPHCLIHDPCAFPVEREIRIWRKVDEPRAEIAERLDGIDAQELLLVRPH